MRLHRFIGNFNLSGDTIRVEDKEIVGQMKNVLRLKSKDRVILGDGNLNEALIEIEKIDKDLLSGKIIEAYKNLNESEKDVTLYCAVLKKENFELVAQKATETGAKEIIPILTERTVKLNLREDRLLKIIREAAEQSERGLLPKVGKILSFNEALKHSGEHDLNLFFDKSGESNIDPKELLEHKKVGVFIGPEGGWSARELEMATENKFKILSLGKLNLRAETAAIVVSYITANKML